mmetsp:Transcript_3141/g.4210  ORF Transcript_3141/g.4210 Transcript_3141/m.4210 type:complete len:137 (-) Transcript_3141:1123-1533(-)
MKNNVSVSNLEKKFGESNTGAGRSGKQEGVLYGFPGTYCFGLSVSTDPGIFLLEESNISKFFKYLCVIFFLPSTDNDAAPPTFLSAVGSPRRSLEIDPPTAAPTTPGMPSFAALLPISPMTPGGTPPAPPPEEPPT